MKFLFVLFFIFSCLTVFPDTLVPFVIPWDDASVNITNVNSWFDRTFDKTKFVTVKGSHLYAGDKRIKFLGVNITFSGLFPSHENAVKIAAHLAKYGINCVRVHHSETNPSPQGIMKPDMINLDPDQMDRLDYFISVLFEEGIYTDMNIHIGRYYPGFPKWNDMPSYFKGIDIFYPPMIEDQKVFAKKLLEHYNPYTGKRYGEDPAIALVEINNEDGLIREWFDGKGFSGMPGIYKNELKLQWNGWLSVKYGNSTEDLRKAWGVMDEPLGDELLVNGNFEKGTDGWVLEDHYGSGTKMAVKKGGPSGNNTVRLDVKKTNPTSWFMQFQQKNLKLKKDRLYTMTFSVKSSKETQINAAISQNHEPWTVAVTRNVNVTGKWQTVKWIFFINEDDENLRLSLSGLCDTSSVYDFSDFSLRQGGLTGLRPGERIGTVEPFISLEEDFSAMPVPQRYDWIDFLYDTEYKYWTSMYRFIKNDIGTKNLVIGTQVGYSPYSIQAELDVVDEHAYWNHPSFPGKPWDQNNWFVRNVSLSGDKAGGTISGLGSARVIGKPYIVSEYNHPLPNYYTTEGFLLLSAYASLQDWDGIFYFQYIQRNEYYDSGYFGNWFDICDHPGKMSSLIPSSAVFLRQDIAPSREVKKIYVPEEDYFKKLIMKKSRVTVESFGFPFSFPLKYMTGFSMDKKDALIAEPVKTAESRITSSTGELIWDTSEKNGSVLINSEMSKGYAGYTNGKTVMIGDVKVEFKANMLNWATLTLTKTSGRNFKDKGRMLITATGYIANTGMVIKNYDGDPLRITCSKNWGTSPSLIEPVGITLTIPLKFDSVKAWSLDVKGERVNEIKIAKDAGGMAVIGLGMPEKTLWYEVEILK